MVTPLCHKVMPSAAALLALSLTLPGCGKKDPEEQFALWSNNEAGFAEMQKYVQSPANPLDLRVRALEVLVESGQPSQVKRIASGLKAKERDKVCSKLRETLSKDLKNPNEKMQMNAKQVLLDIVDIESPEQADKTRKVVGDWAFGDMSPDDKTKVITAKLARRTRKDDIEKLGKYGLKGAEIMLSKGIEKRAMLGILQAMKVPGAKEAMIRGLRRYHGMKGGKVVVSPSDLGFIQRTKHLDGLLYFFEIYEKRGESDNESDEQASSMAIAAAMQWIDSKEGQELVGEHWKDKFKPLAERFLKRHKAEDRFWAAQMMMKFEGVEGLKTVMAGLPDDLNYGDPNHNDGDAKLQIRDLCKLDVPKIKDKKGVYQVWLEVLKDKKASLIGSIIALRCLATEGDQAAIKALKGYIKARRKLKAEKIIADLIGAERMPEMMLSNAAEVALDTIKYKAENAKALAKGKITGDQAKWRNEYSEYTFDRMGKKLRAWCAQMADAKIRKLAKKKAAAGKKSK